MCEACDTYGKYWGQSYAAIPGVKCADCREMTYNNIILVVIILANLILIIFQITQGMVVSDSKSLGYYLRAIGFLPICNSVETTKSPFYIKFFTNYMQIFVILTSLGY
jgi:hypothetical protein